MIVKKIAAILAVLIVSATPAMPWAYQGHQLVGSIADQLLNDRARRQVAMILGFSPEYRYPLMVVGPWADCVRSIVKSPDGTYGYRPAKLEYRVPCTPFETEIETDRMGDYVRMNPNHASFHFADVSIEHDDYREGYQGTGNTDIVHAIKAAVAKLKGQTPPEEFKFRDAKDALLLLAHLVGDIHQPLHMGSVYLDKDGKQAPAESPSLSGLETRGGNSLIDGQSDLHTEWDAIALNLGVVADAAMLAKAKAVAATPGPVEGYAAAWASESVKVAKSAFAGLSFTPDPSSDPKKPRWLLSVDDDKDYWKRQDIIKREQLAKAGARLAEILNSIWP